MVLAKASWLQQLKILLFFIFDPRPFLVVSNPVCNLLGLSVCMWCYKNKNIKICKKVKGSVIFTIFFFLFLVNEHLLFDHIYIHDFFCVFMGVVILVYKFNTSLFSHIIVESKLTLHFDIYDTTNAMSTATL